MSTVSGVYEQSTIFLLHSTAISHSPSMMPAAFSYSPSVMPAAFSHSPSAMPAAFSHSPSVMLMRCNV